MKRLLLPLCAWVFPGFALVSAQTLPAPPAPRVPHAPKLEPELEVGVESKRPEGGAYIRYLGAAEESAIAAPDRLQTSVATFEKGGVTVDLFGVVHLGDAAYYEVVQERLAGYDAVLYEMVGGPHSPDEAVESDAAAPAGGSAPAMASIRGLQQIAKSILGLEFQTDAIDYTSPTFVHADVDWAELNELMTARNESMATLFARAASLSESGGVAGIPNDEAAMEAMMKRILSAVLTGNSAELKRSVAPLLSEAERFIAQLEGDDGTVLVSERNRVVMEKLAEILAERGPGRYAIFYGAGHMPDLEDRLLAEGFRKGKTEWLDAWSIPNGGAAATDPSVSPANFLLRMLSENPEVMTGLQELGTMLEDLGGAVKSVAPPEEGR